MKGDIETAMQDAASNLGIVEDADYIAAQNPKYRRDYCSKPNEFTGDYPIPLSELDNGADEDKPEYGANAVIVNDHVVEWL